MIKVLITDKFSSEGLEAFRRGPEIEVDVRLGLTPAQLVTAIGEYDALAVRSGTKVTAAVIEAAPRLRIIGRAGVGLDNIDVEAAARRGIAVINSPAGNRISTAEHTLGLLLALAHQIARGDRTLRAGRWERAALMGTELAGKTLGIIGLGNIGQQVARRALGLEMRVIAYDRYRSKRKIGGLAVEWVSFADLLARSDVVTVHTPLNDETRGMLGKDGFAQMKPGAFVINAARGGIVDEAALVAALETGQVAGAALDVFEMEPLPPDHPFLSLENVVLTPHIAASTREAQVKVGVELAEKMIEFLTGGSGTA